MEAADVAADVAAKPCLRAGRIILVAGDVQRLGDQRRWKVTFLRVRVLNSSSMPQLMEQWSMMQ